MLSQRKGLSMIEGVTQDQLTSLLKSWSIGYIRVSSGYRIENANAEMERILGRPSSEFVGMLLWDVAPSLRNSDAGELIVRVMEERKGGTSSFYRMRKDDEVDDLYVDLRVHPWGSGVAIFTFDTTELRRSELERIEIENRYLLASRATLDVIYEWDMVNDVSRLSDDGARTLGVPAILKSPAKVLEDILHEDDKERTIQRLEQTLKSGTPHWESVHRVRVGIGYALIRDRAFIAYGDDGKPIRAVGALSDITEAQRAQEQIVKLQSELIHVSRLSAMGTMASVLGHEINQPLAAIGSYLAGTEKLLAEGDQNVQLALNGIRQAREGTARAGDIIRRLRDMTKKTDPQRERIKLGSAVDNAVRLALIGRQHMESKILVDVSPTLELDVDAIQLEQVLINLVKNALEAIESVDSGIVIVRARSVVDDYIEVIVEDNGPGIPREILPALFDFFTSTKSTGLGVGLSISRTIVEAHGGRIAAENRDSGGARFKVVLPKVSPRPRKV